MNRTEKRRQCSLISLDILDKMNKKMATTLDDLDRYAILTKDCLDEDVFNQNDSTIKEVLIDTLTFEDKIRYGFRKTTGMWKTRY